MPALSWIVFWRQSDQAQQRAGRVAEFPIGAVNNCGWPSQPRPVERQRNQSAFPIFAKEQPANFYPDNIDKLNFIRVY
jgi:hypothetical protein